MTMLVNLPVKLPLCVAKQFTYDGLVNDLLEQGYFYCYNLLNDSIIHGLLENFLLLQKENAMTQARIGRGQQRHLQANIRSDIIHWIDGNNRYEQELLGFLDDIRVVLNQRLFLGLRYIETHYALYKKGDFYRQHLDSFMGEKNRIISMVIYFNKNWDLDDGGLLNLYKNSDAQEPFVTILPEYNHAAFFLSEEIPHEVTVTHKNRISVAGWFRCQ